MKENVGKLSVALLLVVGLWIAVYTLWQPGEPPITFGENPQRDLEAGPVEGASNRADIEVPRPVAPEPPPAASPDPPQEMPQQTLPAVIPPQFRQHTVRKGDTLQSISREIYGTSAHAAAIGRANPFMDPSKLRPGRVIRVPRDPANVQGRPRETPGKPPSATAQAPSTVRRTHVVRAGDTLSEISQEMYATAAHARLIYEANKDKLRSPDDLRVGVELVIPEPPTDEDAEAAAPGGR